MWFTTLLVATSTRISLLIMFKLVKLYTIPPAHLAAGLLPLILYAHSL